MPVALSHPEAMDRFNNLVKDLEAPLSQLPMQPLATLPPNHEVRHAILQLLYKTSQQLTREVYVVLSDQLCRTFEDVAKEAITWLIYADDERKLNVPVTVTLRNGLISITQQDQQLTKFLFADAKPTLHNFAPGLIRECLTCDPLLASQSRFRFTVEVLSQIRQTGKQMRTQAREPLQYPPTKCPSTAQ